MEDRQQPLFAVFDPGEMEKLARKDLVGFLRAAADQLEAATMTGWFSCAKPSGFDRGGDDMRLMVTFGLRVPLRLTLAAGLGDGEAEPRHQLRRDGDVAPAEADGTGLQVGLVR